MNRFSYLIFFLFTLCFSYGQLSFSGGEESEVDFIPLHTEVQPGGETFLYLKLDHPEGWYSYYFNNGVAGSSRPTVTLKPVEGVAIGALEYPLPVVKDSFGIPSLVYPEEVYLRVPLQLSVQSEVGDKITLEGEAQWQICKESCLEEKATISVTLTVSEKTAARNSQIPEELPYRFSDEVELSAQATLEGDKVLLELEGDIQPETFYDLDGSTAFNEVGGITTAGGKTRLTLLADKGSDFRDPNPFQERIRGYVVGKKKVVFIDTAVKGAGSSSAEQAPTEAEETAQPSLNADLPSAESLATLYNSDEPIPYRTLGKGVKTTFWLALGGAFIGGILLNLMPCVFPVLSLKVLNFMEKAGGDPWKVRLHGVLFTVGVMLSMWVLAIALFSIKARTGQSINWGQQMGDPRFVAGIVIVLFLFGLNMAGVFEFGTKLTSVGAGKESKNDYLATIFSGVLTTVVATPCSGPFLGAAMGYTLDQSLPVALVIFTWFALGISFPYLLLSFFPALTAKMPRPGAWMETLKKALSFGMFAAAAFFIQTFGAQVGASGLSLLVMALVVIGLAAFFYGHWSLPHMKKEVRYLLGFGLSLMVLSVGLWMSWNAATKHKAPAIAEKVSKGGIQWIPWRPGIVEHFRGEGKYVWVDYTANWCLTCQVNKKVIFNDTGFTEGLDPEKIIFIKADMTDNNPVLSKDLSRVERAQIPVNLLYSPEEGAEAVLLEELIKVSDARKGLELIGY